jgi:cytochrome c
VIVRGALIIAALLSVAGCSKSNDAPAADTAAATAVEKVALSGEELFKRCAACHMVAAGAPNGLGPNLHGVSGRAIASIAGYQYSSALKAKGGVWDDASLDGFIASPAKWAPGGKMAFAGIGDAAERKAIIDYLKAQK